MSDALSRAFAAADRMRASARKAVTAQAAGGMLTAGPGMIGTTSQLTKAAEQYRHNVGWVSVAVRAIAHRIAGQDLFVATLTDRPRPGRKAAKFLPPCLKALGDRLEPLDRHALLDAIAEPNAIMTRWGLMVATVASLELTGRAFWWMPDADGGKRVELWPLPATWVEPADTLRSGWKIRPAGVAESFDVPAEQVALFYLPDPADPFGALSPLQTQAPAVAADESIQVAQTRAFQNGIFPGVILRAGRLPGMLPGQEGQRPVLEPAQRRELADSIRAIYQGAVNYREPLILDGMIEGVEKFTTTPAEMDFLNSGKQTKSRIMQAFGVNPMIVGEIDGANRAQAVVAEETFCQNCVNPLVELFSQVLTRWVGPRFASAGQRLAVWLAAAVAHDDELSLKQWDLGLRSGAATVNEYRVQVLNLPAMPDGDHPMSLFGPQPSRNGKGVNRCSAVSRG